MHGFAQVAASHPTNFVATADIAVSISGTLTAGCPDYKLAHKQDTLSAHVSVG